MERINLEKPRYDQSTYYGRFKYFSEITSPLNFFKSDDELNRSYELVQRYKSGLSLETLGVTEDQLWSAKNLVDVSIHSDTGEKIVLPFRMSSFVPTNLFVTAGMLLPNPSVRAILFWQWLNQSINVGFNWANANKTTPMSMSETALAYGSAVLASCSVAVGLSQGVKHARFLPPGVQRICGRLVPFVAVSGAGVLNVFLMRRKEIQEGITLFDDQGEAAGKSQIAGAEAIKQVAISRVVTALPALTIPPLVLAFLEKKPLLQKFPRLLIPINLGLVMTCFITGLPTAVALFPQQGQLLPHQVESEFKNYRCKNGDAPKYFYYNKGL